MSAREAVYKVALNEKLRDGIFELRLEADSEFVYAPGQFMHIKLPANDHILRRPISIHMAEGNCCTVQYAVVGEGTRLLSKVRIGDTLTASGPFGNGFPVSGYKTVWLLGGGMGVPPLLGAANNGARAFLGFKSEGLVIDERRFAKVCAAEIYTDDGSYGSRGFAIDGLMRALENATPDAVFACGPKPMFRALKARLPQDIPCFISMEERMGCGMGACLVCACKTSSGIKRVCADGPVFDIREVELDG